jgi:hypothetical protein
MMKSGSIVVISKVVGARVWMVTFMANTNNKNNKAKVFIEYIKF